MRSDSDFLLQALLDSYPGGLTIFDEDLRVVCANEAVRKMLDLPDELFACGAPRLEDIIRFNAARGEYGPRNIDAKVAARMAHARSRAPFVYERRRPNGRTIEIRGQPIGNGGFVSIFTDVTERCAAKRLQDGQARILQMIAMNAPLPQVLDELMRLIETQVSGIYSSTLLIDADGVTLRHGAAPSLDPAYCALVDGVQIGPKVGSCGTAAYRREQVVVRDIETDPLWDDVKPLVAPFGYRSCWSTPIFCSKGSVLGTFAMYSKGVRGPCERENALVEVATRIAGIAIEKQRAEERVRYVATHDTLTGLLNRSVLVERVQQTMEATRQADGWMGVMFVDLDNFKVINDSLGHQAGDALLKLVADRMLAAVGKDDSVVRLGGDEFVVLLGSQPKCMQSLAGIVERIQDSISQPCNIAGRQFSVTSSIGVATYPNDGQDVDTLLANADAAMYRIKEFGRNNFQFYAPTFNTEANARFVLQEDLRGALARGELKLHYQPQARIADGEIQAVEALLRWEHPERGLISPAQFIPIAENSGLITQIGDWVLREACRQNKAWQDAGLKPVRVCVNVSAAQFHGLNLINSVRRVLHETRLDPCYLEIELTESLLMADVDQAISMMEEMTALGVDLSIDDFGTGYSSLAALSSYPVKRLKIDKSLIDKIGEDDCGRAVTNAIVVMGHALRMKVLAEGVETEDQLAFLSAIGCDEIQGYQTCVPLPANAVAQLLAHSETAPVSANSVAA